MWGPGLASRSAALAKPRSAPDDPRRTRRIPSSCHPLAPSPCHVPRRRAGGEGGEEDAEVFAEFFHVGVEDLAVVAAEGAAAGTDAAVLEALQCAAGGAIDHFSGDSRPRGTRAVAHP